jgi:hypothetical protein
MTEDGADIAETRRVMREAADHLEALREASLQWRLALTTAGLPASMWNSNAAFLRLISASLPGISLGAFMSRLDHFAEDQGFAWLDGSREDLRAFQEEVIALDTMVQPLRQAVRQIRKPTIGNRTEQPLSRALGYPQASAALDTVARILRELSALAPQMKPLPPDHRDESDPEISSPDWLTDGPMTLPLSSTPGRPLARLRAVVASSFLGGIAGNKGDIAPIAGADSPTQPLASQSRRLTRRRWMPAVGILLVGIAAMAVLGLVHLPQAPATTASTAGTPKANVNSHTSTTATPRSTAPAVAPTTPPTTPPTPKVTLDCAVHGPTATLTITNSGARSLTWQAKPQSSLTVSPTQGSLTSGQSASVRVTTDHKRTATGTITVIATSGTVSTSSSVSCQ